jgi:hypothetical protein
MMTTWKKRILTTAAGLAGFALLAELVAPKAITAVVNGTPPTPVEVTNTQAQPVITQDTDQPARKPYIASIHNYAIDNAQANGILGPKLPDGYRLVVEESSARCESDHGIDAVSIQGSLFNQALGQANSGFFYLNRINAVKLLSNNRIEDFYTSQLRTYVDGGTYLVWGVSAESHPKQFLSCDVSVSGYLVKVP